MRTHLTPEPLEAREVPAAAVSTLPVLPVSDLAVFDHARAIVARGQQLGRRLDTFIRLGDSNSSTYGIGPTLVSPFLNPLGANSYDPAASGLAASNPSLLDTWQTYATAVNAVGLDSFSYIGPGASGGWGTTQVLAGLPIDLAVANPGIALVMVGTNEIGRTDMAGYRMRLTQIVSTLVAQGILPVLSTVPPYQFANNAYQAAVVQINQVIADVAAAFRVPLWNFWRSALRLPNQGIVQDKYKIHYDVSPNGGGSFAAADLQYAQNLRNLQALKILDWFRGVVANPTPTPVSPRANWQAVGAGESVYAVGRDAGFSSAVDVYDAGSGALVNRFLAFGPSFGGGVSVATGDVTGDGIADVVVGEASGESAVAVYAGGSFESVSAFRAFSDAFAGGVSVAVVSRGETGPAVAVASTGTAPVVRLFAPDGELLSSFQAYAATGFGVTLAAVDLDGNGADEIAVAVAAAGRTVRVLSPNTGKVRAVLTAGPVMDPAWGLRLGTLRADGADTLLVGNGPGSRTVVLAFRGPGGAPTALKPDADRAFGIFVG